VATGTTPVGTVTDSDQAYFSGAVPGIDIEVHTNGFDADTATGPIITMGDAVSWQYVVENTGEVPLSDVAVTDDQGVTVSCPGSNLTIGASMTCTSSGVAVPGQYANLGTVTANSVLGSVTDSDPSHYLGSSSRIDIELSTNGEDADMAPGPSVEVGDTVIWTYVVTNMGDVPLTGVLVTADVSPPPGCSIDLLPVAATLTCSHSGMVTPGLFEIVGTVTANGDLGLVTDSDPSHHFGIQAGIDIEVHTNGIDADAAPGPYLTPGSAVTWTYIVMNTGSADLSDIVVEDSNGVPVSCPGSSLAPGGSMTCTASGVAGSGQYQTIGTVTATSVVGSVTDSDPSHYFGAAPGIDIEVSTNGHDADVAPGPSIPVGGMITWTYFVENTGDMPLWNVQVTDNQGAVVTCPQSSLQVNATMTCTALDVAGFGQYANTGSVTATWDGGTIGDSDPSHYFGFEASIDIEVHTNGEDADIAPGPTVPPGSGVTWTYLVSNLGNVDLSSIVVSDNMGVAVSCPGSGLMPGQMMTCEASDVAVSGQYGNIGTVSASSLAGPISDSDPSHYYGDPAPEAWEWTCGWYISLYEQGIISYEDIPTWCLPLPY
jgi:hypothetical protein